MAQYIKSTDFAVKDGLITGDPLKIVSGTEVNDELNAIQVAVNSKADLNSPTLTGVPLAPTAAPNVNTTQIATTAFVIAERTNAATLTNKTLTSPSLTSPAMSGTPTAPTATANTNSTQVATTAFVIAERTNTATLTNKTLTSPALTGTPTAPTAAAGTNTTQVATTAFVRTALLQSVYPVGSIYINAAVNTNPATLLGFGTWAAFGAGRVMVGFDAGDSLFNAAQKTGGTKNAIVVSHTHTGTTNTTGAHTHVFGMHDGKDDGSVRPQGSPNARDASSTTDSAGSHNHTFTTASTGSSGTNANVQPYITVYMWRRTA